MIIDGTRVTISLEEYEDLLEDQAMLRALEEAGVDNWEGYYEAHKIYEENNAIGQETFH